MMYLRTLDTADLERVMELFAQCFSEDHYYRQLLADCDDICGAMKSRFSGCVSFCLESGIALGTEEDGRLTAFVLLFDYNKTKQESKEQFNGIFGVRRGEKLPYYEKLHQAIEALEGRVLYLLSVAVAPDYQRRGLASELVDRVLEEYPDCNLVSDVSNKGSLRIYEKRNFRISSIGEKYYYVVHEKGRPVGSADFSGEIHLLVPDTRALDENGVEYGIEKELKYLAGYEINKSGGLEYFVRQESSVTSGALVRVSYESLLRYQRLINISQVTEHIAGDTVFYGHISGYTEKPLYNHILSEMVKERAAEWSLIPDVFVSVPVQYQSTDRLESRGEDMSAGQLLRDMDFRTHYEAGVPSAMDRVDDLAGYKNRIRRYYLEKVKIQIFSEITPGNYSDIGEPIGPGAYVDMYISADTESSCAVLTWYSLSAPFLISHLFDNTIRNQVMVIKNGSCTNFFDYIKEEYGLVKCGTPKIFSVFPCDRKRLKDSQLASLLAGETIYPEGENFGGIIDGDILSIVQSERGMGQYDRAFVCAYSNAALQFSENFCGSIAERLCEESITLFYIELILFEEAAIHIADREIINLFSSPDAYEPVDFLSKVDAIYDGYSRTIDFWDIKVNYPTSQKSIAMLRRAFRIKEQLEDMKRNQEQLQTAFDTKCDIIDRQDAKRMDTSLAIISVLAVFSAWIDGYDYIATWTDVFSQSAVHTLQRIVSFLILLTAGYAVTHLFGGKLKRLRRKYREGTARRNRRSRE